MKFQIGDRVICTNPADDASGHHLEWRGISGTVVSVNIKAYSVRFDTIPAYYSVIPMDLWFCSENELEFENQVVCAEVGDLL